jgi:hypothetical protein
MGGFGEFKNLCERSPLLVCILLKRDPSCKLKGVGAGDTIHNLGTWRSDMLRRAASHFCVPHPRQLPPRVRAKTLSRFVRVLVAFLKLKCHYLYLFVLSWLTGDIVMTIFAVLLTTIILWRTYIKYAAVGKLRFPLISDRYLRKSHWLLLLTEWGRSK